MNIISNNCLSGLLYKNHLNTSYKNPFVWTVIDYNSMSQLIKKWDIINFNDYELEKDNNWLFSIIIEKKIKIQYVHYHFDPMATTLVKYDYCDIKSNNIWEYITHKYEERIARMTEAPMFCIMNFSTIFPDAIYTDKQLNELCKYGNTKVLKGYEDYTPIEAAKIFYKKVLL